MDCPIASVGTLGRTLAPTALVRAVGTFTGNAAAAAFDGGTTEDHADGHTDNSQHDDGETHEVQHD